MTRRPDVIVVGRGALGAASAAELHRRGRKVLILAPNEASASSRAAGMLAPAFESILDAPMAGHAALLKQARDLWPPFAEAAGVTLYREGAEWRGAGAERVAEALKAHGFEAERDGERIFTPDDWRLEPDQALVALGRGIERVEARLTALERTDGGFRLTTDGGELLTAPDVVLATGWAPVAGLALPPVEPIKGQAVRLRGPTPERVVRGEGVYVAPAPGGCVVGATMEAGASDLTVDAAMVEALLARATAIAPEIAGAEVVEAYAAVRGASPDGLPYAGLIASRLAVALAPRRNGWLLAPIVAGLVADALESGDPDVIPLNMDLGKMGPGRFAR